MKNQINEKKRQSEKFKENRGKLKSQPMRSKTFNERRRQQMNTKENI